jgi:hypothetical protein
MLWFTSTQLIAEGVQSNPMTPKCERCDGARWVCEAYDDALGRLTHTSVDEALLRVSHGNTRTVQSLALLVSPAAGR